MNSTHFLVNLNEKYVFTLHKAKTQLQRVLQLFYELFHVRCTGNCNGTVLFLNQKFCLQAVYNKLLRGVSEFGIYSADYML